jgi:hypothetical protein
MICVKHEINIILDGKGLGVNNYCNKCNRTFSKETLKRIITQWNEGYKD